MDRLNWARVFAGGVVAGVILWLLEGLGSLLYREDMQAAMTEHGLSMEMSAGVLVISLLVSLLMGIGLVWLYASVVPRYGAGAKTAVLVAVALWLLAYVTSLLGYGMMGLFPSSLVVLWAIISLVEMVVAALVGTRLYKEA